MTIETTTEAVDQRTEAEREAELLFELGQHYRHFTDLEMVDVHPTAPDIDRGHPLALSRTTGPGRAYALTMWALSLTRPDEVQPTIHACAVGSHCLDADVFVCGTLASGRAVRVWAEVRGFSAVVGLPDPTNPTRMVPVAIDQLFDFESRADPVVVPPVFSGDLALPATTDPTGMPFPADTPQGRPTSDVA